MATNVTVTSRPASALMEDPVFLAITGVILCFGIIFLLREIVSRIKNRRYRRQHQRAPDQQRIPRTVPSLTLFRDDPPPYPGKYSKTNINYLPSYDSALKMAPELRMCNIDELNQPTDFPVLHEHTDDSCENISDHGDRDGGTLCDVVRSVSVSLDPGDVSGIIRNPENPDQFPDDELDYSATNVHGTDLNVNQQTNAEGETRSETFNAASGENIENSELDTL